MLIAPTLTSNEVAWYSHVFSCSMRVAARFEVPSRADSDDGGSGSSSSSHSSSGGGALLNAESYTHVRTASEPSSGRLWRVNEWIRFVP